MWDKTLEKFRLNLKYYRKRAYMKQYDLCAKAGFSDKYISNLERGRTIPSLKSIVALAEILEIEPYQLIK